MTYTVSQLVVQLQYLWLLGALSYRKQSARADNAADVAVQFSTTHTHTHTLCVRRSYSCWTLDKSAGHTALAAAAPTWLSTSNIHCVSKKNRTPITFWNNSNKLCLIIIMISWENRQKVLNIVVCYGLTIFHKAGHQLRINWSSAWWRSGLAYGRPLSMTQSTNGENVSGPVFE